MNKTTRHLLYAIIAAATFIVGYGCSSDDFRLSSNFINSGTSIEFIDSVGINLSTYRLDSVITSQQGKLLVGSFHKDELGTFHSEPYFRVSQPSYYSWSKEERYDSMTVVIYHTGDYEGDTLQNVTLDIRRVTSAITKPEGQDYFYNNAYFPVQESVGSYTYRPQPTNSIKARRTFRISDVFGRDLFKFIRLNTNKSGDELKLNFKNFLPGFRLDMSAEKSDLMLAYKVDSIQFRLHTHLPYIENKHLVRSMSITKDVEVYNYQFNHTWVTNSGDGFSGLTKSHLRANSSKTNGHSMMFEGLGYYTIVSFPSLDNLRSSLRYGHFMKATLKLYPDADSYDIHRLPSTFYLTEINKWNALGNAVYTRNSVLSRATLNLNSDIREQTYYSVDLTYYVNTLLTTDYIDPKEGVVLTWGSSMDPTNFNYILFNGQSKERYKSKLELYYYYYDKEGN